MREALRGVGLALRDQVPWRTVATLVVVAVMIFALGFLIVYMVAKIDSVANTPIAPVAPSTVMPSNMPGMDMGGY